MYIEDTFNFGMVNLANTVLDCLDKVATARLHFDSRVYIT